MTRENAAYAEEPLIITLIRGNDFNQLEHLFDLNDPRLSFKPLFITIYRSINANNIPNSTIEIQQYNIVMLAKFCVWVLINNRFDIFEALQEEFAQDGQHEWTFDKFQEDCADLFFASLRRLICSNPITTQEILQRLCKIDADPNWERLLMSAQSRFDRYVNVYLHGIIAGEPQHIDGIRMHDNTMHAQFREQFLRMLAPILDTADKRAINNGLRLVNSNLSSTTLPSLLFANLLTFGLICVKFDSDSDVRPNYSSPAWIIYTLAVLGLYALATPILVPISAALVRALSFGNLEIGCGLTQVATRMSVNTMLGQYANHVRNDRSLQDVTPSSTPNIADLEANDLPGSRDGYFSLQP